MDTQKNKEFKISFFTIRVKLLGIILGLVTFGILLTIILASTFFRNDTRIRITENSLALTKIISRQIEYNLQQKIQEITNRFQDGFSEENIKSLLRKEKEILYIGFIDKEQFKNNQFLIKNGMYNRRSLVENKISVSTIDSSIQKSKNFIKEKNFFNKLIILNATHQNKIMLGISIPLKEKVTLIITNPNRILNTIRDNIGFFSFFVIDTEGKLLLHSEKKIMNANVDISQSSIVKNILQSSLSVKTFEYREDNDNEKYLGSFRKIPKMSLVTITTTKSKIAFSAVDTILFRNLGIAGIVILIANFISYFFSKTIIVHILRLVKGTKQIERGNYNVSIHPKYKDEIGILTNSFNHMALGLAERERVKSAFGKFVNEELVKLSLKKEIQLSGAKKEIAILFSDIRSFTSISEKLSPEKVVSFLNDYFTVMVDCIEKKNGIVDKYIGDAIMAHWGSLETETNKTNKQNYIHNAVESALLMREATLKFNQKYKGKHPTVRNGFGVHFGSVIIGQIGTERRLEFTAIGDPVNLASRLEGLCKILKIDIIISNEVYEHIKNKYRVIKFVNVPIKGKANRITVYGLLGPSNDPNTPNNIEALNQMLQKV